MRCGDGILLVDKPAGVTSFAVVDRVRRALLSSYPELAPQRRGRRPRLKCGHAGSLDPLATGLLILMCGQGTRLSPFLMGLPKQYHAVVRFGVETDSLDADGQVRACASVPRPDAVMAVLPRFQGDIQQVPPVVSALKRQGQRLYKLARRGAPIPPLQARSVRVSRLQIEAFRWDAQPDGDEPTATDGRIHEATLRIDCSSGTYVRALARDLATAAGTVAHIKQLRRERIGPFSVVQALGAEQLDDGVVLLASLFSLPDAVAHLSTLVLTVGEEDRLRQGGQPERAWLERLQSPAEGETGPQTCFRMLNSAGSLVAMGELSGPDGAPRSAAVFPVVREERQPCG